MFTTLNKRIYLLTWLGQCVIATSSGDPTSTYSDAITYWASSLFSVVRRGARTHKPHLTPIIEP